MQLTVEQRRAAEESGHVCIVSCPGSGKTRVIIAKLLRCVEAVRESTRRVACITHTNAAADEVESRLSQTLFGREGLYYHVQTIHGFALGHILRPYHHLLPEFSSGFSIITSDDERYTDKSAELIRRFNLNTRVVEDFDRIQRNPGGQFGRINSLPVELQREWCDWLDSDGLTTLGDIVFHAQRIVSMHRHVASALASHFAWILVDEFQDSSPAQIELLNGIYRFGRTQFFCVGDPNQSIYGFAGASPSLLEGFATHIGANRQHRLSGNFRSSARICAVAERLHPTNPPMRAVGAYEAFGQEPVHETVGSPLEGICERFLPAAFELNVPLGEIAILAPWWVSLYHLGRELRQLGFSVIGPGARPYKRSHLLAPLLEVIGAYLESPEPEIALSIQRSLFILLADMHDVAPGIAFDYRGRLLVCTLIAEAAEARRASQRAVDWIENVARRFERVLIQAEVLSAANAALVVESGDRIVADIARRDGGNNLNVEDIGIFARPKHCIQLLTVHKAKGREFEAVALIDAHDGRFPHFSIQNIEDNEERQAAFDESRRVVYVATTRAKRILMFFTDYVNDRNRPSPFLAEMGL